MKQYKKPAIVTTEMLGQQIAIAATSPGSSYSEEGSGVQLTRQQLWLDEEQQ